MRNFVFHLRSKIYSFNFQRDTMKRILVLKLQQRKKKEKRRPEYGIISNLTPCYTER